MKKMLFSVYMLCFAVILMIPAFAYIDPSAVTYTAQAVAAVVVAIGALITVFRHKIVAFFKKNNENTAKREIHIKEEASEEAKGETK